MFPPPGSCFAFVALEVLAARLTLQIHSSEPFDFISFRIVGLAVGGDRTMDTCANLTHVYLTPRTTCTLHHVYTSSLHLFMVLSHGITPEPTEPRHRILDFWSSLTTYGHPPSHYVLAQHLFYNYIRIQTHHVSNQRDTVISPDHRHAYI
jgi:hypothetical protein